MKHPFFTQQELQQLQSRDHRRSLATIFPVVKLFTPDANATWLVYEQDAEVSDLVWAVCDLGLGFVEAGPVSVRELQALRGKLGLPIEKDLYFTAEKSVEAYLTEGQRRGYLQA